MLYVSLLASGGAFVAVIYLLRLDRFSGWEKALVDLVMVAVAVGFLVSLYMALDAAFRGPDKGGTAGTGD